MPTTRRSGLRSTSSSEGADRPWSSSTAVDVVGTLADRRLHRWPPRRPSARPDRPPRARPVTTARPNAYRFSRLATDVVAVLDEVGLSSAAVCGFSLGANTALRTAACYPDRVDAVAAIGSDPEAVEFADLPTESDSDDTRAQFIERDGMARLVAKLEDQGRPERARLVSQADPLAMAAWMRGWNWSSRSPSLPNSLCARFRLGRGGDRRLDRHPFHRVPGSSWCPVPTMSVSWTARTSCSRR